MKKFILSILAVVALLFVGCQTDIPDGEALVVRDGVSTLTVGLPQSQRTMLGDKGSDGVYPVYWSEDDQILVNGVYSKRIVIDDKNPSVARFEFDGSLNYPLTIRYQDFSNYLGTQFTYFANEQSHIGGSFAKGNLPMYGVAERSGNSIVLNHLAGVIRLSVKGDGVALQDIVVKSESETPISGYYIIKEGSGFENSDYVGQIIPLSLTDPAYVEYNCDYVRYICDTSRPLSTSQESVYYIALPEGEHGKCIVELTATNGKKMICKWLSGSVKAGVVNNFNTVTFEQNSEVTLEAMGVEEGDFFVDDLEGKVFGYVIDNKNNPIEGVAVSDGFSVTTTNKNGYYELVPSKDAWYLFVSLPSEYEVPMNEYGQPCFYKRYSSDVQKYNFQLTPLAGGKEKKFALFAIADPQIFSDTYLGYFNNEAVPGIKAHCAEVSKSMPCYGITLGDIISNDGNDRSKYRDDLRDGFAPSKTGMPVFQVMGNHDYTFRTNGVTADERSSTQQIKMQRDHEEMFGPANYSFERGDIHFVAMRNIIYTTFDKSGKNELGFMDEQVEWLRQDLALVPKDKMVVLCVHIPMMNTDKNNNRAVLQLINQFKEVHILSGHHHYNRNYNHPKDSTSGLKIYEHIVNALCGSWWDSYMGKDGAPNGYQVFVCNDGTVKDGYYMGYHEGQNVRSHQMRLYRGDAVTGKAKSGTDTYGVKGYYKFNYGSNVILANIFNADSSWKVEVYEDGVYSGDMSLIPYKSRNYHDNESSTTNNSGVYGDGTESNPYYFKADVSDDIHFVGLYLGVLGKKDDAYNTRSTCYHMYKYTLRNPNAKKIEVRATDLYGNVYTESEFTTGTDYSVTGRK